MLQQWQAPKRRVAQSSRANARGHGDGRSGKRQHDEAFEGVSRPEDAANDTRSSKKRKVVPKTLRLVIDSAAVQSASYALELMSATQGTRLYCIGHILKDDVVVPWYYDASGSVCTDEPISMIHNFPRFAALVVSLACLDASRHGALSSPKIQWPSSGAPPFPYPTLTGCRVLVNREPDGEPVHVTLGDHIFTQYCLVGRRTFIYVAHIENGTDREADAVIKLSYQPVSREREQDLVAAASGHAVKHLPEVHMAGDLWEMKGSARDAFFRASECPVPNEDRVLRAIVYHRYRPVRELFVVQCLLIPVMVDQMIDCEFSSAP